MSDLILNQDETTTDDAAMPADDGASTDETTEETTEETPEGTPEAPAEEGEKEEN